MKKFLIILGSVIALVIVALLVAPMLIPVDTYKSQLLAQIEKATGRKARIEGDFGLSLLPRVEFTAGKVALANAPGGKTADMLTLEKLDVRVAVFPLLSGTVVVDSLVLEKPVINLEVDRGGKPNWVFAPAGGAPAAAPAKKTPAGGGGGLGLSGLQLGDVRLVSGQVSYTDARTGETHRADDINMSISLPSLDSPMEAEGSLVWNKEKISLTLGIGNPNAFLGGKTTNLSASVSAAPIKLSFKGSAASAGAIKADGDLDLDVPSVRKLAAWAGQPLTMPGETFGPLTIAGKVSVDGQKYGFTGARLQLDKLAANGDFRFDASGRKPYVNARLDTGMLDLNPYLGGTDGATAGKTGGSSAGGPAGKPAQKGWSDDPIDMSALRQIDADSDLTVAGLMVRKITIGKSRVKIALKNGKLVTDLTEMALYEGNGRATVTADASASVPAVTASLDLSGLQANPALSDAIDLSRIEGTLNTDMKVATSGKSQRAMISALNGSGKVIFKDGAIRGINIGAMVRNVSSAFLDPSARERQKTDFAELSGTFQIARGILTNDDLTLLSPLLRVGGKGRVDLPQQTVNYRIEPKLVASTTGQGGSADQAGIKVPVIVSGPWDNLSYRPDLAGAVEGIAKDPKKALEGLKKMIPGGKSSGGEETNPADTLKKLFGR